MRTNIIVFSSIFFSILILGCQMEDTEIKYQTGKKKMLPAWKLPEEMKIPGKADQYDDYRAQHPEWYAVTVAPDKTGFRSYTEYEDVQALLLAYPESQGSSVNASMTGMVKATIEVVDTYVVVPDSNAKSSFTTALKNAGITQAKIDAKVHFLTYALDSIWMVDFGPFPIVGTDSTIAFADFRYYQPRIYDDAIPTKLGNLWGVTTYRAEMDYEGGNFTADGLGTCYYTQGAFWENPDKSEKDIKDLLKKYLGCTNHVVLAPLPGEGTTHIDMFFKPVSKGAVVHGKGGSTNVSNTLEQDYNILKAVVLTDGSSLTIFRIPMPYQSDGVWRTYTNSTFVNSVNLVPVYDNYTSKETEAMNVWKQAMPSWTHVGIASDEIITWGGAMHCISRTIPKGTYSKWVASGSCVDGKCQSGSGGYNGECGTSADCSGPAWVCNYNDCGGTEPAGCGDITYEGCCDGNLLKWCEYNKLQSQNCSNGCGWNSSKKYYDCGYTGSDPSGNFPKACPGTCTPNCTGKQCGDNGCGGSCGTCESGKTCQNNQCVGCTPNCTGKQCGDNGCGGSCGTCESGKTCQNNQCVGCIPNCTGKQCGDNGCGGLCGTCQEGYQCDSNGQCILKEDPCKGISWEGCCDGNMLYYCENNQLITEDCTSKPKCGWSTWSQYYNCGTKGNADPSGNHPMECPKACVPDCNGKDCGDNGCGGSCGNCTDGKTCSNFKCEGCKPACSGKECGDNGCGGTCGECKNGGTCENGICVGCQPNCTNKNCGDNGCGGVCGTCKTDEICDITGKCIPAAGCGSISQSGMCDGNVLKICEDNKLVVKDCGDGYECSYSSMEQKNICKKVSQPSETQPESSEKDATCVPDCAGKDCGDNGCGGVCGSCSQGYTCSNSKCVGTTTIDASAADGTSAKDDLGKSDAIVVEGSGSKGGGCAVAGNRNHDAASVFLPCLLFLVLMHIIRRQKIKAG
jgi:agmatine/peptidylarginine deiminase